MKKFLLISLILAIAAAAGYFLWELSHPPTLVPWDLVPEDAVAVYERRAQVGPRDDEEWIIRAFVADSLRNRVRRSPEFLISVHVIGKEDAGTILYLPDSANLAEDVTALKTNHNFTERIFEGYTITEIQGPSKKSISVATVERMLVISTTSFLLEDVIRLAKAEEKRNFARANVSLFSFTNRSPEGSHVYLNISRLPGLFDFFLTSKNQSGVLDRFARSGVIDLKSQDRNLLFTGFVIDSVQRGPSILSLFNHQRPVPVTLHRVTSARTGMLIHFGISDYATWANDRGEFCRGASMPIPDSLASIERKFNFDAAAFYNTLGSELGISSGGVFTGEVLAIKVKNPGAVMAELAKLQKALPVDVPPVEDYSHVQIRPVPLPQVTRALFWPLSNRDMNYYTITDQYLVFAENDDDLKSFVDDTDAENTWGKSTAWNGFLSTTQETNAGVIFDAANAWTPLRPLLTNKWQAFGDSSQFLNINRGSFQFARLEHSYYLNGVLEFNKDRAHTLIERKEKFLEATLASPLMLAPRVVTNHTTGGSELISQDKQNNLILLSSRLKNLFTTRIDGAIRTAILQVDYYRNKKLQYLFATDNKLWLIDRLGKRVDGFPKQTGLTKPARFLTVVDYDNSRRYKFLLSDDAGKMVLLDHEGRIDADWKGADIKNDLFGPPQVIRSRGVDYIFAVSEDGILYGFDKHGTVVPGYPVKLNVRPSGAWTIEQNNEHGDVITVIDREGLLVQADLKGRIVNRNNFVKSSASSSFYLSPADAGHYVVSRIDRNKIAALSGNGNVLFEIDNPGSKDITLTFFETAGKQLYAFTDPQQEFTYFFGSGGRSIFSRPLENQLRPAVIADKAGTLFFYGVNQNSIRSYKPAKPTN